MKGLCIVVDQLAIQSLEVGALELLSALDSELDGGASRPLTSQPSLQWGNSV